jgi:hypothetical protein
LVGQHWQLYKSDQRDEFKNRIGIQIGKFHGLVQPLGYNNLPLTESAKKLIREEHRRRGTSVTKLADDWDVSESHIREVLKGDKPPVLSSRESINIGILDGEPPVPGRVVPEERGCSDG